MNSVDSLHDQNAERAVLGSVFLDRDAIIAIAGSLEPLHFFDRRHQFIYEAQYWCFEQRIPPDLVAVAARLKEQGRLNAAGGAAYLAQLANSVPTAVHIEYYARTVRRYAKRRKALEGLSAASRAIYNEPNFEIALAKAEAALLDMDDSGADGDYYPISEVCDEVFSAFQRAQSSGGVMGVPSGFRDLDALTGGFQNGDLIIIAARPAVGKSSLALSIAYNAALRHRVNVGFFSLEMAREQLVQRMIAIHTGLDVQHLRTGTIRDSDLQMLTDALGTLSGLPIYLNDQRGLSVRNLASKAKRMHAQTGLDLLIVDYLQLLQGRRQENRVQEVSEISRGLKILAGDLGIPVIALSQLSRAVEGRTSHVPMLSDLRESGSIEQDADMVLFIYREETYEPDSAKKGVAEIHLAKHRNGPTGVVPLRFFSHTTRFADLERYRQPEGY